MKVKYNKEAHKVYSLIYHLIFVVKYRKKVFKDERDIDEPFESKIKEEKDDEEIDDGSYGNSLHADEKNDEVVDDDKDHY